MGVLGVTLLIIALKIPIVGLWAFVYWLIKEPKAEADTEKVRAKLPPRLPQPGDQLRPRRRGPHGGGAARPLPSPRRDPHPVATPRETVPAPSSRSTREVGRSGAAGAGAE
jgi:hypothetical protein